MYLKVQPNEHELDRVERPALAHIRLNNFEWDELVDPKPQGFDELPEYTKPNRFTGKRKLSKADYVRPAMIAIESIIGKANISRVWWKYGLGRTEEEWFLWYCSPECLLTNQITWPFNGPKRNRLLRRGDSMSDHSWIRRAICILLSLILASCFFVLPMQITIGGKLMATQTTFKPRMTLDDVLSDMRAHGMPMEKRTLAECLRSGIFPFASIVGTGPTGRTTFLIMRKDYDKWAAEYLHA